MYNKSIIGKGNLDDLFITFLIAKARYDNFTYNHFSKNLIELKPKFAEFLNVQNIKFQIFDSSFDEIKEYFNDFEIIDSEQKYDINPNKIILSEPTKILKNENFNRKFVTIQIDDLSNNKLKHIKEYKNIFDNIKYIGETQNNNLKNYNFLYLYDKFHIIRHSDMFIGFEGIYSYFASLYNIKQLIITEKPKRYFKQWEEKCIFFNTEEELIKYLKTQKYERI